MKRLVILFALPALLLVIWFGGQQRKDESAAEITIATDRVTATRGEVINTINTLGGVRLTEDSTFGDDGSSQLTFRLPTRQLERAIAELNGIGGQVASQSIDLTGTVAEAQGMSDTLGGVRDCLGKVSSGLGGDAVSTLRDQLQTCDDTLLGATDRAASAPSDLAVARLTVTIQPERSVNPFLVIAALAILAATLVMGVIVIRSTRRPDYDDLGVDDDTGVIHLEDDLFSRRN